MIAAAARPLSIAASRSWLGISLIHCRKEADTPHVTP